MTVDHYNIDTLLPTVATICAYSGYYITLLVLYDTIIHHESEKEIHDEYCLFLTKRHTNALSYKQKHKKQFTKLSLSPNVPGVS
jgi:hypothetical protein